MTNGHFESFDENRRITIDVNKFEWMVMDGTLKVSEDIYRDLKEKRAAAQAAHQAFDKAFGAGHHLTLAARRELGELDAQRFVPCPYPYVAAAVA